MKPNSRRTSDRSKAIFNYRLLHAQRVIECAFGICASKWRILDKAIETKVDTGIEIVKCTAVLHNIITNFEGLHDLPSNICGSLGANDGTQFKKSRIHNCYRFCQTNVRPILQIFQQSSWFCTVSRGSYWRCGVIQSSLHYVIT